MGEGARSKAVQQQRSYKAPSPAVDDVTRHRGHLGLFGDENQMDESRERRGLAAPEFLTATKCSEAAFFVQNFSS